MQTYSFSNFFSDNFFMKKFIGLFFVCFCVCNLFSLELYKTNVIASFYAEDFHGKKTSNGERFNMYDLTCAHKSLPFNTILKVTNLANGKSVNVRVNDRGPFILNREIDLSKKAASELGMIKSGTTKVKLEIVKKGPNTKASVQTAKKASEIMAKRFPNAVKKSTENNQNHKSVAKNQTSLKVDKNKKYNIQVGAFSSKETANKTAQILLKNDIENVVFQTSKSTGIVRVVIKNVSGSKVGQIVNELEKLSICDYLIKQAE